MIDFAEAPKRETRTETVGHGELYFSKPDGSTVHVGHVTHVVTHVAIGPTPPKPRPGGYVTGDG